MSYYRVALSAAKNGNITTAYRYARVAFAVDRENQNASQLVRICRMRLFGCEQNAKLLEVVRRLVEQGYYKKAYKTAFAMSDCLLKYNICGCLLAVIKHYRAASKMLRVALEYDRNNKFTVTALAYVASRRSLF